VNDGALRLSGAPAFSTGFALSLAAVTLLAVAAACVIVDQLLASPILWTCYGVTLVAAFVLCTILNVSRNDARCVALTGHTLTVPVSRGFGRRAMTVRLDELRSAELTRRGASHELKLSIPGRLPVSIRANEVTSGDLVGFHQRLLASASCLNPDLVYASRLFERRNRVPVATAAICLALALVFLASQGGEDHPVHRLIVLGGLNDWLVSHGELFRLGAAALLHADWLHLLINAVLLLVAGMRLEYVTGPLPFAGAFVSGLITGNLAAYLWGGHTVVVGASGGVFALLALYAHTLMTHRRHLPTRTQFAPNTYLLAVLLVLFIPLPGYAESVHIGGFAGGLAWSLIADRGRLWRRVALMLGAGAWVLVALASWHGLTHGGEWLSGERAIIERMAGDPAAGLGSLDLVGWYALQQRDPALMEVATARLEQQPALDASSAGTLAELWLVQGETVRAARHANLAFELDGDREARERLMQVELAAYADHCAPAAYGAPPVPPPRVVIEPTTLRFASDRPLYVHALVNRDYLMVPTGISVGTTGTAATDVTVLGYSDTLPWRRKPRVQHLGREFAPSCGQHDT
jgi:membrane associated rhomboid family serine protease